jgi:hypothetical protein
MHSSTRPRFDASILHRPWSSDNFLFISLPIFFLFFCKCDRQGSLTNTFMFSMHTGMYVYVCVRLVCAYDVCVRMRVNVCMRLRMFSPLLHFCVSFRYFPYSFSKSLISCSFIHFFAFYLRLLLVHSLAYAGGDHLSGRVLSTGGRSPYRATSPGGRSPSRRAFSRSGRSGGSYFGDR